MRVRLRALRSGDLPVFFEHQRDAAAAATAGSTIRARPAFDDHWRRIAAAAGYVVRTIEVDGEVAGYVSAFPRAGRTEIAYWIGGGHRGRGVGRIAVAAFLDGHAGRPLYASVLSGNAASLAILHRCGFVTVATEPVPDRRCEIVLRLD